jgi:hypothetical protein
MKQYIEREMTNALGDVVRVRITIDTGAALEKQIVHLANKASRSGGKAKAAGGVVTVEVIK